MAIDTLSAQAKAVAPGLVASLVIATAAAFLAEHYGAPVMLFALLLGIAMNHLGTEGRCKAGVEFASRDVLRIGVALLGCRITIAQMVSLGWQPVVLVLATVTLTIGVSVLVAKWMGFNPLFGLLSGGATAICGASAALALSAALPGHPLKERATLFAVIGVSTLSTLAMIVYPAIAALLHLDASQAGLFIGATIHDVAQVIGAGYAISPEAGDTATVVKLLRVATLLPVVLLASMIARRDAGAAQRVRPPLLPWFLAAFVGLVLVNGWIPKAVLEAGNGLSRWCLITAIAAIGTKTRLGELAQVGIKPVLLMLGETAFLAGMVLAAIRLDLV